MLLVIEIMLTISAWRKGWKGWVALPWVVGLGLVMVLGAEFADSPDEGGIFVVGLVCDVLLIITLGIMAATARGTQEESQSAQDTQAKSLSTHLEPPTKCA